MSFKIRDLLVGEANARIDASFPGHLEADVGVLGEERWRRVGEPRERIPDDANENWYSRDQWRAIEAIALSEPRRFVIPNLMLSSSPVPVPKKVGVAILRTWRTSWLPWRSFIPVARHASARVGP